MHPLQQSRSWDDKHVCAPECHKTLNPPVSLAWYSNTDDSHKSKEWISGGPGFNEYLGNWNSFDLAGCYGSLRAGADTGNFSIRYETAKVMKNCLKSTIVAEVTVPKVPKKGDLLPLPFAFFYIAALSSPQRTASIPTTVSDVLWARL